MRRETPLALYKGLGAVLSGIVPKMAIRFASFERYKGWLADRETGVTSVGGIFVGEWVCFLVDWGEGGVCFGVHVWLRGRLTELFACWRCFCAVHRLYARMTGRTLLTFTPTLAPTLNSTCPTVPPTDYMREWPPSPLSSTLLLFNPRIDHTPIPYRHPQPASAQA